MAKRSGKADKNLTNTVKELEREPVNGHHAQQLQQDTNDRRHQDQLNHDEPTDLFHSRS